MVFHERTLLSHEEVEETEEVVPLKKEIDGVLLFLHEYLPEGEVGANLGNIGVEELALQVRKNLLQNTNHFLILLCPKGELDVVIPTVNEYQVSQCILQGFPLVVSRVRYDVFNVCVYVTLFQEDRGLLGHKEIELA